MKADLEQGRAVVEEMRTELRQTRAAVEQEKIELEQTESELASLMEAAQVTDTIKAEIPY